MRAGGHGAALKHLAYIEREGVEKDGSKGRMFDGTGDVDRRDFGAAIPGEQRQFRFIISPEDGNELDLREYTAALMSQVEKDLGRELRWAAVCHYNTDNPHVHVVVRGVDARGDDVRIDRDYISSGLRLRAQELATRELGPRTEIDILRQTNREVGQERLTNLDRQLSRLASPEGVIDMSSLAHSSNISRPNALARLETLESLDLVERTSPTSWRMAEGWQETLRQLGERGDVIKRMHHALEGRASSYRVFQPGSGAAVEGIIKQKGLHDELSGAPYVIVQTPRMEAVYVRLDPTTADTLKEGAAVRLTCEPQRWVKTTDPAIQREAVANGGIYDPTAHLRKLGDMPVAVSGRWVEPKDVIAVNQRRLERLERYKLVTHLPDGRWRVPPDLVSQLEAREHSHPQYRLQVEPLGREAPAQARGDVGDSADRAAVGARLAKELGLAYVESPERFRGRLFACPPSPSGREYVRVVDFATGRFTLAPKPPEATKLEGRVVSVALDRQRGLSIEIDRGLSR
jgi:type IV secretory pathway VirD2 relaxase